MGAKGAEKSAVHPPRAVGKQRRVEGQGERESVCMCVCVLEQRGLKLNLCECSPALPSHPWKWDGLLAVVSPGVIISFMLWLSPRWS